MESSVLGSAVLFSSTNIMVGSIAETSCSDPFRELACAYILQWRRNRGLGSGGWHPPLFYIRFNKVRGYAISQACNSNWRPPILMPLTLVEELIHRLHLLCCTDMTITMYHK